MVAVVLSPTLKFRTREGCLFHFSNILANYKLGDVIQRPDAQDLEALLAFHADFIHLIGLGVAYFQKVQIVRMNRHGEFAVVRVDDTAVGLSHRDAILGVGHRRETKTGIKNHFEIPLGLSDGVTWIPNFSPLREI